MKRTLLIIALVGFGYAAGHLTSGRTSFAQGDPCGSSFRVGTYFEDLEVTRTVDHHVFTVNELMEMIDKQPNVRTVTLQIDPPRHFSIETLAYPQFASRYELTKGEWADLQSYAREKLKDPIAIDDVIAHWRSIAAGTPPFGLRVQDK